MKHFIKWLCTFLIPINEAGNKFSIKPSKAKTGFIAKYINHDTIDIDKVQTELAKIKPLWQVTLFPEKESFHPKTGEKVHSQEMLYFGPNVDTDESDEICNLFE